MITEKNPQASHQGWQISQLINEINSVLNTAGIVPDSMQSNQLIQALSSMYGAQGTVTQETLNNIITAAGSKLPSAQIQDYPGSKNAPGSVYLANAPRGEYLVSGYFADSPLGSNSVTYGLLITGATDKNNVPVSTTSQSWFYQEYYNMTSTNGLDFTTSVYYRTNINNTGWSGWCSREQLNLKNQYGFVGGDRELLPGNTFFYDTGLNAVNTLPLNIACGLGQLYEIDILHKNPSAVGPGSQPVVNAATAQANLDLGLLPNNTNYNNCFSGSSIATQINYYLVNGQTYLQANPNAPAWINTTQTGAVYTTQPSAPYATAYSTSNNYSQFWFDDVDGAVNPPYLRKITLYTGDKNTLPIGLHFGGGGGTAPQAGVNNAISVWTNFPSVGYYTSLGTLQLIFGPTASFTMRVKRIW